MSHFIDLYIYLAANVYLNDTTGIILTRFMKKSQQLALSKERQRTFNHLNV